MQRILCTRCGDSIHSDTAKRNNGLCIPCVRGNTLTIGERTEIHRKQREQERAYRESPEYKYWISIVRRVYDQPNGFGTLAHADRLYYLLNTLTGEVHNGGFDQFFSNSSGDRYTETLLALKELGVEAPMELLLEAKHLLFDGGDVPTDQHARFEMMPTSSPEHRRYEETNLALDQLDKRFYACAESINSALSKLAQTHSLYQNI